MRRKDREVINTEDILKIVDKAKILRLGITDGNYPYIVPLHFGYELNEETFTFYMHCANVGKKLDLIKLNPNACIELDCDVKQISGGEVACMYGSTFSSVIAKGKAELVENDEKIKGLKLLMLNQTGRDFEMNEKMAAAVTVIKVVTTELTAKSRPYL